VAEVEQPVLRALLSHLQCHPARGTRVGQPEPPGDPQQAADGFAQVDWRLVGELEHDGELAAPILLVAHLVEQRLVVGEQQDRRAVRADVVQHGCHGFAVSVPTSAALRARRQASRAFGRGGHRWAAQPRASHRTP
jgi:hypothetical protein